MKVHQFALFALMCCMTSLAAASVSFDMERQLQPQQQVLSSNSIAASTPIIPSFTSTDSTSSSSSSATPRTSKSADIYTVNDPTYMTAPTTAAATFTMPSTPSSTWEHDATKSTSTAASEIPFTTAAVTPTNSTKHAASSNITDTNNATAINAASTQQGRSRHPVTRAIWFLLLITLLPCLCLCGIIMCVCYGAESGLSSLFGYGKSTAY